MRYVDEFRSGELARALAAELAETMPPGRELALMEVCGGHTHAIYKHGIDELLPPGLELVHGPGCPVCVIPVERVDEAPDGRRTHRFATTPPISTYLAAVVAGQDAFRFHREVGLVFQDPDIQLFSATVLDDVAFGPLQLGLERDEVGVGPAGVVEGDGGRHERHRQAAAPGLVGARHGAAGAALQVVGKARVHEGTLSAGARQGKPRRVTGQ